MSDSRVWMGDWRSEEKGVFMPVRVYAADGETIADVLGGSRRVENAALIAAAPALVRALLRLEWSGHNDSGRPTFTFPCCPACRVAAANAYVPKHHECWLDAALTAAGFPDHASRYAGRARMAAT